ncbi:succinoglycan biosynthesis protein exop [Rhizobium sp. CNPSo 3464]|uniref:succinoglycan biosynthesis protein exop n=1 Tax=Rhizobium sp. CNPSo 3464 TaxID=3021406 RepID=UPI00254F3B32|nr:succinoglycan biosynthesis protein exop [Rhizobium sp. CNPSo 3464]MDK4742139.1 succinoglycan biosynthesis protein exop [Rhizobium sp. CNPSo 3464]
MFESKARTRYLPDDAEAFGAYRGVGRHAHFDRGADGYLIAANVQPAGHQTPGDAELLALIQKMLDGDPYPVSGRKKPDVDEAAEAQSLPDRIRGILRDHPVARGTIMHGQPEPIADQSLASSSVEDVEIELSPLVEPHAVSAVTPTPPRRWVFGFGSIAFVIVAALAGAFLPTMLAAPPRYVSHTVLQIKGQGAARQALLDVTAKRAAAPSLLSDLVARLKLDRDPEFTGDRAGAFGVAMELLSGSGNASDAPSRAQAALRGDIAVTTDAPSGTLHLAVTTSDPAKSAEIANHLADATIYDATVAQGAGLPGKSSSLADRSRKDLDQAKAALADFKAQYGDGKIEAALDLQRQRRQLDEEMKASEAAVQSAKARVFAAKSATPASVTSGALSGDLSSAGLDDLRSRYSAAKVVLSQLSTQLGPRHPRLLAQQATVDGLAADIRNQLQRLIASSDTVLKAALENRTALSARMTALSQKSIDVDMARLGQLQDDVAAAQSRYDADLQNADTAPPEVEVPIAVIAPAVAAKAPLDDNLAGSQAAGFVMGLGAALCLVFLRKWMGGGSLSEDQTAGRFVSPEPVFSRVAEPGPLRRPMPELPQPRFDATIPVANDRPVVTEELTQIQRELALLRTKVQTYASRRQTGRG